jgi:uncharacterized RDD family membrane protein YckC
MTEPRQQVSSAFSSTSYVGFLYRLGAWGIDKALVLAMTSLLAWQFPQPGLSWSAMVACGVDAACLRPHLPLLAMGLLRWMLPACATVLFLTRLRATPGKLLFRAQVVDARTGKNLSVSQAWIRVIASLASYLTLGLGHLLVIVDARKQALHDKIAGSVVIRPAITPLRGRREPPHNPARSQFRRPARRGVPGHSDRVPPRRARTARSKGPGPV